MAQQFAEVEGKLFNVVVVREIVAQRRLIDPIDGKRHRVNDEDCFSEVVNVQPMDWDRARLWLNGLLTGIGRDWKESRFVDVYLELADCPRPFTEEIQLALTAEHQHHLRDAEYLRGELLGCQGLTYAGGAA